MIMDQPIGGSAQSSPRPVLKLATNKKISQSEHCLQNTAMSPQSSPTRQFSPQGVKWTMYSQKPTTPPLVYSQPTPPQSPYGPPCPVQCQQPSPPLYYSHTPPMTPRVSQTPINYSCSSPMSVRSGANTIIINPAGAAPSGRITPVSHPSYNGFSTPSTPGYVTPGRVTPGRITSGRCTPVYTVAMKKRYVDIMLASTASTVAIDNKIEQAMDLVKSHLMFAVREEVDVLKERIGELMERINHLEYENTVLRKYASPEVLQQLQHPSANP